MSRATNGVLPYERDNRRFWLDKLQYPGGRVVYIDQNFASLGNNPIYFACRAKNTLINTDLKD